MNDREARFSQPKRELFGLKEALRMNKKWLFGVRKLVVETDAKYIKGMLENPDMMPTATINRWIDEILLYSFTLRHKAGATFGPDGLSRRSVQEGDPSFEPCSDDEDEEVKLPRFEVADPSEPQPLPIEEFVDQIETRRGYFYGIAESVDNFRKELDEADRWRAQEQVDMKERLARTQNDLPEEQVLYVQQLVNTLALPIEESRDTGIPYAKEHRSVGALQQDSLMTHVIARLRNKTYKPKGLTAEQHQRLERLTSRFLIYKDRVYRRGTDSQHRLFVSKRDRTYMMTAAHDHNGHRGFFATKSLLTKRFWWPEMECDIKQFVKSCHSCQERQQQLVKIPPSITRTPGIFEVIHVDVMHMTPPSNGCKYIVHGRDNLTSWPEARGLRDEKARSIALWLYEEILCRWGSIRLMVSDNGESFKAALQWIQMKWGIKHITISPYNSQANGSIERPHWDLRQMLYKATGAANVNKWYWFLDAVLWADRVSVRRRLGCSPYYFVTGLHPILPLDAAEATWLADPPNGVMSETDMIASRARTLAKHHVHVVQMRKRIDREKLKRLERYEEDYKAVIKDYSFKPGDLVMIRNTAIEKSLDKKMKPRYNGPMIVVAQGKNGAYIVAEMTGAVLHQKIARFRVVPYFARTKIALPEGIMAIIDADKSIIEKIDNLADDETVLDRDYLMDTVQLESSDNEEDEEDH
jgi:hypothetical protein